MGLLKCLTALDDDICPVDSKKIAEAVKCLYSIIEKQEKSNEFLGSHSKIMLTIGTHRIPSKKQTKYLVKLPVPLFTTSSEICIFTKDINKEDIDESRDFYDNLFNSQIGFKPKIVPLLSINKDYKSYESRRQLACSYDLFLGDERIYRFLPERLGKIFYRKNIFPREVNLRKDNFKQYFEKVLSCTQWIISGKGHSSMVHIAMNNFTEEQVAENITACLKVISKHTIRGWGNIRSIHLKTESSLALPLYECNTAPDDIDVKDDIELKSINEAKKRKSSEGLMKPKVHKRTRMSKSTLKKVKNEELQLPAKETVPAT